MNWIKIIRQNAREYRQVKNDLSIAEWRLKSLSEILKATGTTVSWYGERLIRGRSPEEDTIRDGVDLYAVSK